MKMLYSSMLLALAVCLDAVTATVLPWQKEFLDLTNKARENAELPKVCLNAKLNEAAHLYAKTLEQTNTLSHDADGTQPGDRAQANGFQYQQVGENLASDDSAEGAFKRLMKSPGHRENILKPDYKMMGVGGTTTGPQHEGKWVQLFGTSSEEQCLDDSNVDNNGSDSDENNGASDNGGSEDADEFGGDDGDDSGFDSSDNGNDGDDDKKFDAAAIQKLFPGVSMIIAPGMDGKPVQYEDPFRPQAAKSVAESPRRDYPLQPSQPPQPPQPPQQQPSQPQPQPNQIQKQAPQQPRAYQAQQQQQPRAFQAQPPQKQEQRKEDKYQQPTTATNGQINQAHSEKNEYSSSSSSQQQQPQQPQSKTTVKRDRIPGRFAAYI